MSLFLLRGRTRHSQSYRKERWALPMAEHQLPQPFDDLTPYLAWSLPTERERSAKRQSSSVAEISTFYQAMLLRMDEVLLYLAQYPPENVPPEVQRLFYLALALAEVA